MTISKKRKQLKSNAPKISKKKKGGNTNAHKTSKKRVKRNARKRSKKKTKTLKYKSKQNGGELSGNYYNSFYNYVDILILCIENVLLNRSHLSSYDIDSILTNIVEALYKISPEQIIVIVTNFENVNVIIDSINTILKMYIPFDKIHAQSPEEALTFIKLIFDAYIQNKPVEIEMIDYANYLLHDDKYIPLNVVLQDDEDFNSLDNRTEQKLNNGITHWDGESGYVNYAELIYDIEYKKPEQLIYVDSMGIPSNRSSVIADSPLDEELELLSNINIPILPFLRIIDVRTGLPLLLNTYLNLLPIEFTIKAPIVTTPINNKTKSKYGTFVNMTPPYTPDFRSLPPIPFKMET